MDKLLTAVLTVLMLLNFSAIVAQDQCGTSEQTQFQGLERLFQNRIDAANQTSPNSRDVTVYVPIKFHIVSKTDGAGGISEASVINLLCHINTQYANQDMIFYINYPFNYISNTSLYNNPGSNGALFQIQQNWDNSSVNLFIVNQTSGNGGYYSGGAYEHIIMKKSNFTGQTAVHEIGHFFTLAHPFLGWGQGDDDGWNPTVHGNPVGTYSPAGIPFENEKMDGSNCLWSGDRICDTPPDYLFASSPVHNGGCNWYGGAMDPNGVVVETIEENVMNYFQSCSGETFTPDQKEAIRNDFNLSSRAYLRHSYVPSTGEITEAPELIEPIDNEVTPGYNLIYFDWEPPADGAQRYLLEIDQQPTFAFLPKRFIVANGSSTEIEDIFSPNTNYYWRVTPYNDGNTCNIPTSIVGQFTAGESVSVKNIEFVNDWSVIPNPVRQNQSLNIQIDADEAFNADIRLYNMTGKLVKFVSQKQFNIGANNEDLDISGVGTGMYIVAIQSDRRCDKQKDCNYRIRIDFENRKKWYNSRIISLFCFTVVSL